MRAPTITNGCTWQTLPDGRVQCPKCETIRNGPRNRNCQTDEQQQAAVERARAERTGEPPKPREPAKPKPPMPSLAAQGIHFATALLSWVRAGRPVRSEEEINRLLEICQGCEYYEAEREVCLKCGCCNGTPKKDKWLNKVAWATEKCPVGKW